MKALITGATGFVGAAVARAVAATGTEVRLLIRRESDLRNLEGLSFEPAYYALWARDPSVFYEVNVEGTRALLETARELGTERIVYTSTIGAIGLPPGGGPGTEETPVSHSQIAGDYKRSKYLAEQEALAAARRGLPVVIVNPSAPVGERDIKPTPTGQIIVDFMKGRMWAYIETGMNLIDVEDVGIGHVRAMERGRLGERYILGTRNLSLREIFEILSRLTGVKAPRMRLPWRAVLPLAYANRWAADHLTHRPPRIPLEGVKMAKYRMHYDCSKARRELDLPQTPVETALEKAVRWFRDHGYA
jgi:dihydroflavonol-4-reductase